MIYIYIYVQKVRQGRKWYFPRPCGRTRSDVQTGLVEAGYKMGNNHRQNASLVWRRDDYFFKLRSPFYVPSPYMKIRGERAVRGGEKGEKGKGKREKRERKSNSMRRDSRRSFPRYVYIRRQASAGTKGKLG